MGFTFADVSILEQSVLGIILAIFLGGFGWTWRTYVPRLIDAHTQFLHDTAEATGEAARAMAEAAQQINQVHAAVKGNHERLSTLLECGILVTTRLAKDSTDAADLRDLIFRMEAMRDRPKVI
jgi:hypothetical protein